MYRFIIGCTVLAGLAQGVCGPLVMDHVRFLQVKPLRFDSYANKE